MNVTETNQTLETKSPQDILAWAIKTHPSKVGLSSSFGGQSVALIHMAIQLEPKIPILFINTGFLFKETIAYVDALKERFNLNVQEFKATSEEMEQTKKNLASRTDGSGECCDVSKVRCMNDSLKGLSCWIAGLRRSQGKTRKDIDVVEEFQSGLVKVHPLANWSGKQLYEYMKLHDLPFHPLWEKGFTSIGCEPCTSLPIGGKDERSGRWAGMEKKECGIHTFMDKNS